MGDWRGFLPAPNNTTAAGVPRIFWFDQLAKSGQDNVGYGNGATTWFGNPYNGTVPGLYNTGDPDPRHQNVANGIFIDVHGDQVGRPAHNGG